MPNSQHVISSTDDGFGDAASAQGDKTRSSKYMHHLFLMGMVVLPPVPKISTGGDLWCFWTMHFQDFTAKNDSSRSFRVLCKAWNFTAQRMVDTCKKHDQVLVQGRLIQDTYWREVLRGHQKTVPQLDALRKRGVLCIAVSQARLVSRPGNRFIKGHVQVPVAEYKRLKMMERELDPQGNWIPSEVLDRYRDEDLLDE